VEFEREFKCRKRKSATLSGLNFDETKKVMRTPTGIFDLELIFPSLSPPLPYRLLFFLSSFCLVFFFFHLFTAAERGSPRRNRNYIEFKMIFFSFFHSLPLFAASWALLLLGSLALGLSRQCREEESVESEWKVTPSPMRRGAPSCFSSALLLREGEGGHFDEKREQGAVAPDALALAKQHVTIVPPCYIEYSTPLQSDASLEDFSTEEFGAPSVRVRQPGLEPLEKRRHPISSTSSAHLPRRLRGPARQRHRGAPELGRPAQPHRGVGPPEAHRGQEATSFSQNRRDGEPDPLRELRGRRSLRRPWFVRFQQRPQGSRGEEELADPA